MVTSQVFYLPFFSIFKSSIWEGRSSSCRRGRETNIVNDHSRDQTLLNDHDSVLPEIAPYLVERCLSFLPDEVKLILKSLPVEKATGPDGLSNCILSVLADELSIPVCALFNQSLQHRTVPVCFKETHVCPRLKDDDPPVPSNYRPISLLSNLDNFSETCF